MRLLAEKGPRKRVGPCVAEILSPEDGSSTIKISFFTKKHCFGLNLEIFYDLKKSEKKPQKKPEKTVKNESFENTKKNFVWLVDVRF